MCAEDDFNQKMLTPLPGASISYYILARHDLKKLTNFWEMDTFIGTGDLIPGLESITVKKIVPTTAPKVSISDISINAVPDIIAFEEKLLETVRDVFFEEYPETTTIDVDGNLLTPVILERRLHFGFHNAESFIGKPSIVSLSQPVIYFNPGGR
jgi:hypothetical protein